MGYDIIFTDEAEKNLDELDKKVAIRIIKKLKWFSLQDAPLSFASRLTYPAIGQYRFRTGDYRVIVDCRQEKIIVLRIGHRSTIYR